MAACLGVGAGGLSHISSSNTKTTQSWLWEWNGVREKKPNFWGVGKHIPTACYWPKLQSAAMANWTQCCEQRPQTSSTVIAHKLAFWEKMAKVPALPWLNLWLSPATQPLKLSVTFCDSSCWAPNFPVDLEVSAWTKVTGCLWLMATGMNSISTLLILFTSREGEYLQMNLMLKKKKKSFDSREGERHGTPL